MTAVLFMLLALALGPGEEQPFVEDLLAGRVPYTGLEVLDGHLAFERALDQVLAGDGQDADALAGELLLLSPLRVPRSFTDGRAPTGWDLVQRTSLDELVRRRPGLAGLAADVEFLLSPDVWQVDAGLQKLDALVAEAGDEPAVSALLFGTADRLAPFSKYHARLADVLGRAVMAAPDDHARRMAVVRLAAEGVATPAERSLWEQAARTAPTSLDSELVQLASFTRAATQADAAGRDAARVGLLTLAHDAAHPELARRALARLARTASQPDEVLGHTLALRNGGAGAREFGGLLLVLVRDRGHDLHGGPGRELAALIETTSESLEPQWLPCLQWAAAQLARERGEDDTRRLLLEQAAAPALAGQTPAAPLAPRSEWWLPLDEAVSGALRPVEYGRAACWELADLAWEEQRWEDVLRYGALPPPAEGCGNVIDRALRRADRRRAAALEGLARTDEAEALLRQLLTSAGWDEITRSAVELVEFSVRVDRDERLQRWLDDPGPGLGERAALTRDLLGVRRAAADGRLDEARRLAAPVREALPTDASLRRALADWLGDD
jgi:hypothetical protein